MYQFLVLVNTRTKIAFATGNQSCKAHYTKERNYEITTSHDSMLNRNYAEWARLFQRVEEFTYEFFYGATPDEARSKANSWLSEEKWELHSSRTRPSLVR